MESNSSGGEETLWEAFTILDAIKTICDSWKDVKILTGVWRKLIPKLTNDSEGLKISVEEVTADVVEVVRELELQVKPEVVTKSLPSHHKNA